MPDNTRWSDDDLDDREYPDPDEDDVDDAAELIPCPNCGESIYEEAPQCPYCGEYLAADTSAWSGRPLWWVVLGVLGVVATLWVLMQGF